MVILASELNKRVQPAEQPNSEKSFNGTRFQPLKQPGILQAIIEGLVDGVLVLTKQGELVYANEYARRVCHQLAQGTSPSNSVPQPIWHVCEFLLNRQEPFSEPELIVNHESQANQSATFRIRVRWLILEESAHPYLLVTIEDQCQFKKMQAIADAKKYGLTPREAEVWSLHEAKLSYKEIADQLYITLNTVKKHMKNIYAKQQEFLESQD